MELSDREVIAFPDALKTQISYKYLLFSLTVTFAFILSHYSYVFHDASIFKSTQKISSGPYSGLYSTTELQETFAFIDSELKQWTSSNEYMILWKAMPIEYNMANSKICAPSAFAGLSEYTVDYYSRFSSVSGCKLTKIVAIKLKNIELSY